jgi:hypothetical protein
MNQLRKIIQDLDYKDLDLAVTSKAQRRNLKETHSLLLKRIL